MDLAPLTAVGALVFALVNTLKYASARNWNAVFTQLIAWGAGVVGILIFAQTAFAATVKVSGVALDDLNFWSQFFVGLMATSLLSTLNEGYKAIDPTVPDSAKVIKLFPRLASRRPAAVTTAVGSTQPPPHKTG